ncbi:MAG TPA: aspartyl protease family protein [Thermoanaerobaculia bacterium]
MNAIRRAVVKTLPSAALLLAMSGCSLYSDVSISPLILEPSKIERGTDVHSMIRKNDYLRAIEMGPVLVARQRKNAADLGALGTACLAAGRYDDARQHLRSALDLGPFRTSYAQIAWDLSQVEYLQNNYETSLEWANIAMEHGLGVRRWHIDYLTEMTKQPAYRFQGLPSDELPMRFGRPNVPRLDIRLNKAKDVQGIIDSGAVLSIISQRLATELSVRRLGTFRGEFYGLLGEPISVEFGMLDSIEIGAIIVENVPVAIMPDAKMSFLITDEGKREFKMDFLLGANLLKEFRIDLNFDRNRVTFTKLTSRDRVPAPDQNLFFEGFRPFVRGTVNGRGWFLFVLDTGSEVTFLNDSQMHKLPVSFIAPRGHNAVLQGLGGAQKNGAKLEGVSVGVDKWNGSFRTIPMYESEEHEPSAGIIGENFLRNFNVTIDFGRMRLDLVRR